MRYSQSVTGRKKAYNIAKSVAKKYMLNREGIKDLLAVRKYDNENRRKNSPQRHKTTWKAISG